MEEEPTEQQFQDAIRRTTLNLSFTRCLHGERVQNRGVQPLLDGVQRYLPDPTEIQNVALIVPKTKPR